MVQYCHLQTKRNLNELYVLSTDTSKHSLSGVLTQEWVTAIKGKDIRSFLSIMYVSGTFVGSKKNRATLTKEVYAIYMAFKKLSYWLYDAKVTMKSDHTPLHKFLTAHTLNSKVNNWGTEKCKHEPCYFWTHKRHRQ